ncbi:MAG: hypothetical protein J3K34DRAFT_442184 [Monoraphidium minutum]|nr:MAG: hypothetical protein J3K34DRAFT_442184 [Monoraphidium minutum]
MLLTRLLQRAAPQAASRCAPRPAGPARRTRRPRAAASYAYLRNMEPQRLTDAAHAFVAAWAEGPGSGEARLRGLLAPGAQFKPDGVVFRHELEGADAIVAALRREHARLEHKRYEVVATAVDPEDRAAFVAVAWEYAPKEGGGQASRGLSLKQFLFDDEGRVRSTRVARQMTEGEKQALLSDPSACHAADLWRDVLPALQARASNAPAGGPTTEEQELAARMLNALRVWDGAWGSDGADSAVLPSVCSPDLRVLDGYGLHGSGDAYGLAKAQEIISSLKGSSSSATALLHAAVNPATRVGFSRWEGKVVERSDADKQVHLGGLDLALFDTEGRIEALAQFTMRPYPQLVAPPDHKAAAE